MSKSRAIVVISMFAMCASCSWWNRDHVAGNYYLDGTDGHHWITDDATNHIVIGEQIVDVATRSHYVLILREPARSYECGPHGEQIIYTEYSGQLEYWVLDADSGAISGPLDGKAYAALLKARGLPDVELEQTAQFIPYSNGSRIPQELRKSCNQI